MNKTQEALKMAIEALDNACIKIEKWTKGGKWTAGKEALAKCKEALEQPAFNGKEYMEGFNAGKMFAELEHPAQEVGEAEIRQMLNDIEYYQKRVKELEQPLTRDWKETIDERIAKDDKFKEALAQPAMTYEQGFDHGWEARLAEEQPKQEPVSKTAKRDYNFMRDLAIGTEAILNEMLSAKPIAWTKQSELDKTTTSRNPIAMWKNQYKSIENNVPLYTHPAPSWQGLSDDEIQSILDNSVYCEVDAKPFARAIEQKLKDKNT